MAPHDDIETEDRELRELLAEAHRGEPSPPPFRKLWSRARAEAASSPQRWRLRLATAGGLAVLLLALGTFWSLHRSPIDAPPSSGDAVLAEAQWDQAWAGWEGPLDFLLDTPGRTYLESVPTISTDAILDSESLSSETLSSETLSSEALADWKRKNTDAL